MHQPRFLDRTTHPHIATLIMATAFGPVAMNVFLPSLPAIARYFESDFAVLQLAVSLYLTATAALQLIIGPLSDRYGRRPVLLGCLALALVSTLAGIYAPTVEVFLAARMCQGTAVAGMVIGRAVIRDMVDTDEAASRIGYVTMAMALAPMVGPVIGGYLGEIYGWQATFWLVFGFGLAAFMLAWADLGETNKSRGNRFRDQLRAYPVLFRSRRFWGYSATAAFASGAFFAFLGGGPYLASEYYRLSPSQYGYYFGMLAIGYVTGNFLSGRFSRRVGINLMALGGGVVAGIGMLVAIILYAAGLDHPLAFYGPMLAIGVGNGITLPNANAGVVGVRPQLAGSASGLGGFFQIGGGAALSVVAGAALGPESGPMPLILLMLVSSVFGVIAALYVMGVERNLAHQGQAQET